MSDELRTRYAVSFINKDGMRQVWSMQGRSLRDTREEAEAQLAAVFECGVNHADTLRRHYGDVNLVRVDPVECYAHGDPCGLYIADPESPFEIKLASIGTLSEHLKARV